MTPATRQPRSELADVEAQVGHRVRYRRVGDDDHVGLEAAGDVDVELRGEGMRRVGVAALRRSARSFLPARMHSVTISSINSLGLVGSDALGGLPCSESGSGTGNWKSVRAKNPSCR